MTQPPKRFRTNRWDVASRLADKGNPTHAVAVVALLTLSPVAVALIALLFTH